MEDSAQKGRVEHFNEEKGYGFIKHLASVDKYFFHINDCKYRVKVGDIVFFELERGQKGLNAVNVRIER
jgi:cold shock CspA family protein